MAAATPTFETVATAIKTAMDAISPTIGTVYVRFHWMEDDVAFLIRKALHAASIDVWFIDLLSIDEQEGDAAGEVFEFYNIEIRYWCQRTANEDWSKEARQKAEAVRDALSGAASIFAISSQRQLLTPETVRIVSHGQENIRGGEAGDQMLYVTRLALTVEARRWAA